MQCVGMYCSIQRMAIWAVMVISCWSCAASQSPPGGPGGAAGTTGTTSQSGPVDGSAAGSRCVVPYYPPPSAVDLCGEPVPLQNREVLERFDREFTVVVYNHAQVYLWLKRMERYFPWIEERLRANGLPDDLKYVAVVESDLLPDACSPKGAAGPWQFMPATGSAYGLQQKGSCDERYDFERATECAFRYLNDLHKRYKSWTVAIATYNCGDKRIQEQIRTLGSADYYQMRLPTETERYVFRILAVKAILGNPVQYGYHLPKGQGYPPMKAERVNVQLSCPLPMQAVAEASGTTMREIKRLNPAFRADEIPEGSHQIKVPAGSADEFEKNIDYSVGRSAADETPSQGRRTDEASMESKPVGKSGAESRVTAKTPEKDPKKGRGSKTEASKAKAPSASKAAAHTVKKGETLSGIAARYNVSVGELRKANKLKSGSVSSGQRLVIP